VAYSTAFKNVADESLPGYIDLERVNEILEGLGSMRIAAAADAAALGPVGAAASAAMAVDEDSEDMLDLCTDAEESD